MKRTLHLPRSTLRLTALRRQLARTRNPVAALKVWKLLMQETDTPDRTEQMQRERGLR